MNFEDQNVLGMICGVNDSNIPYLENLLDTTIYVRGVDISYDGENRSVSQMFHSLMKRLEKLAKAGVPIAESEIFMEYQSLLTEMQFPEAEEAAAAAEEAAAAAAQEEAHDPFKARAKAFM